MKTLTAITLAATLMAAPAFASKISCDSGAQEGWMSKDAILETAKGLGYDTRAVKVERGCYEVYAISPKRQRVEAFFNPTNGELVGVKADD